MLSPRAGSFAALRSPRSFLRQHGAAIAEYLPPLSFIVLLSAGAYGQYGETLRTQMSLAANKFAENYYHGWFWPETTLATNTSWGAPANGTQGTDGPSTGATGSGGDSNGSGTSTDNTPSGDGNSGADTGNETGGWNGGGGTAGGNNPDNNAGGGLSSQAASDLANLSNSNSSLGSAFLAGGTGAGGEPMQCSASSSNSTNPFSSPTPQSSPALNNAPSFTALGNPIDIGTGNKFQAENDYTGVGANALVFARYYNSVLTHTDGGVGPGWRYSYQRAIAFDQKSLTATVWRDDGTQYVFNVPDKQGIAPLGVIDQLERTDSGWTYTTGSNDRERYDTAGRLQRIDYAAGQTQTVSYNSQGQLVLVRDTRGTSITLNWRGQHLHSVELPTRQRIGYSYDDALNLRRVVRSSDKWIAGLLAGLQTPERQYHYDDKRLPHALTGLDDATGVRYATWAYDQSGRGILSQHGNGAEKIRIAYQASLADGTRRVTVTNALGLKATYTLEPARAGKYRLKDIEGQPMISCAAIQSHHRYDDKGFVRSQFNADRIGNLFTRNQRGLIEIEQRGIRFDVREQAVATEGATRIERQWDKEHAWLLSETLSTWVLSPHGTGYWQPTLKREFSYDNRGRVLTDTRTDLSDQVMPYVTQGATRTRTYRYDWANAEHTQLQTLIVTDANHQDTTYRYDNDRLQSIENPLHQVTVFSHYNLAGQAEAVQLPNGQTLHIAYNDQGLPARIERIASGNNESIAESSVADYDAAGRLKRLTLPDGSEQFYRYNSAGQLTQLKNRWGETLTFTPNALTGAWEIEQLRNTAGELVQSHQRRFNAQGQLSALIGNAGQQTDFHYSANGDLIEASERDQNPANDNLAHTTQATYDTQHRLLELIDAAGYSTHYAHSASGAIAAVTDANHNTTQYIRNGFGDIIEQDSPTTGSVIKHYDANGNVIANQSPGGEGVKFEYDALNRLVKVDYPGEQNDIRYTYDQTDSVHGNGVQQLTHIETPTQAIDYRYDESGRKVQEINADKDGVGKLANRATLAYHYLHGNRLDRITYPDGSEVHYHFDKDRITEVSYTAASATSTEEKTILKDIAYAPFGGPIGWTYGSGLKQTKQLDQDGRVTDIALNKHSEALWSQHYQYDLYQNIAQINRDNDSQQFAYDKMDRLIREQSNAVNKKYAYDPLGNRTEEIISGEKINYGYSGKGLITSHGKAVLTHDDAGNLIKEYDPSAQQNRRVAYDNFNKMAALYDRDHVTAHYHYNALGWRDQKKNYRDGERQRTLYSYTQGGKLVSENVFDEQNTHINYLWLGAHPIAQITHTRNETQVLYVHDDHLAAPRVATNNQQKIVWRWTGDAFGNGTPNEDPDQDGKFTHINLRFPGQYADVESGLIYNLNRYYDPARGSYTQSDPMGQLASMNTYSYVDANPVSWLDPLGLAKLQYVLIDSFGGDPTNSSKSTLKGGTDKRMPHFAYVLYWDKTPSWSEDPTYGDSLIYDPNGIETQTKDKGWYSFDSSGVGDGPWQQFLNFYKNGYGGANAVNTSDLGGWAGVDIDDDNAAELYHTITGIYPEDYKSSEGGCTQPEKYASLPALPAGFYAMEHFKFPTIVHKLTKPIFDVKDLPGADDEEFLNVPWFPSTFDSEGGDNKDSIFYSRVPEKLVDKKGNAIGNSGVTIGRGFDLGQQSSATIKKLMTRIGLTSSQVDVLAGASGQSGAAHVKYFDDHKDALKTIELTREQQYLIYMYAVKNRADDAKTGRYELDMKGANGTAWENLDENIKMLMVDLNYRGDLNSANRVKLKDAVSKNDLKAVCTVMSDQNYWVKIHGVPQARFDERKVIVCE